MRVAGRYELVRPLGRGAMAVVDLARDVELDRRVAVKRLAEHLARDGDLRARFLREARLAARLAHPNVVRIFDVGEDGGTPFIAMEYVDGETLADLLARRGALPADEAAGLGVQLCRGLASAHAAGLVHRDVKPQNLLLGRDGVLKLGDFGVARGADATRLTQAGTVLGTAAYLAPEQARGEEVTAAADVYAAGTVLYELLTGAPPRAGASLAELGVPVEVQPPAGAPPALARVLVACLAPEPRARPSAAEAARLLAADDETLPLPEPPTAIVRRPRVRPALVAAILAAVAVTGGAIAALASRGGGTPAPPRRAAHVPPVPHASSAQQQAQNLAAWLTRQSR
jgi:eukaryotic-like serine/threonine-protein kinase